MQANECIPNRKDIVFCDGPLEERAGNGVFYSHIFHKSCIEISLCSEFILFYVQPLTCNAIISYRRFSYET